MFRFHLRPAVAALGSALILLAGSATADAAATTTTTAAAKAVVANPFSVSVHHIQQGRLMPGGPGRSFEFSVTNHGSKAGPVDICVYGRPHGAVPVMDNGPGDVAETIQVLHGQDAVLPGFYNEGKNFVGCLGQLAKYDEGWAPPIEIPAHTTFTWKLTLAVTKVWPVNDDGLRLSVFAKPADAHKPVRAAWSRAFGYRVGTAHTGGPVVQSLTGPRELRAGRPVVFDWTVTNRTGAALHLDPHQLSFGLENWLPGGWGMATYRYELWDGHHWLLLGTTWGVDLPSPGGLANGASLHYRIRATLGGRTPNRSVHTLDFAASWYFFSSELAAHHSVAVDRG